MVDHSISGNYGPEQSCAALWGRFRSVCAVLFLAGSFASAGFAQTVDHLETKIPLAELVSNVRQKNNLIGLGAIVMVDGQVVDVAVDGERRKGSGVKLEVDDRWHLGSITKSITATMIARLIESGQMKWTDSVGSCFPDESIHEDWAPVTLRQLLTHTSGAPANFSPWVALQFPKLGEKCARSRKAAVLGIVGEQPEHPPSSKFLYSNVGYTIAGAMAEQATGLAWSDLVKREVYEPLTLTSAGFGSPKSETGKLDQPRGHRSLLGWKMSVGEDEDNTPIIGPAGIAHMNLRDLATYASEHLQGELGHGKLLSQDTYKLLHSTEIGDYACGWVKPTLPPGTPYTIYWHNGSNTMWYALVVFIPQLKMVIAVTSNEVQSADAATWEIVNGCVPEDLAAAIRTANGYPKKSPFAAVRWKDLQPEVQLEGEWFVLKSINDISTAEIIAFSQKTYDAKYRKRFEEDLIELLSTMGHPPQDEVKLELESITTGEVSVREGVLMTTENRDAIRAAAGG